MDHLSPRKRRSVLECCDAVVKRRKQNLDQINTRSDELTEEEITEVEAFYRRENISRMCPGRKGRVSVKKSIGREKKQEATAFECKTSL